jgi:hypothetical protein
VSLESLRQTGEDRLRQQRRLDVLAFAEATVSSCPTTRVRTTTMLRGVTVPSASMYTAIVPLRAGAATTGTVRAFGSPLPRAALAGSAVPPPNQNQAATAAAITNTTTATQRQWRVRG